MDEKERNTSEKILPIITEKPNENNNDNTTDIIKVNNNTSNFNGSNKELEKPKSEIRRMPRRLTIRRLNTMPTYEDIDVDKYLDYIATELNKLNHSLDERMFIDLILNILDQKCAEYKHDNFNRLLFFHIIEFGNFQKDSPILLQEILFKLG